MSAPAPVAALPYPCTPVAAARGDLLSTRVCHTLLPVSGGTPVPGNIPIFPMMHHPNNSGSATKKEGV